MSTVTQVASNNNSQATNFDTSKFLLGNNSFIDANITAGSSAVIALLEGEVMGRIASTQKLTPCVPTATDGSQIPVGICVSGKTVAKSATESIRLVNKGEIAEAKINFSTSVTLDSLVVILDGESTPAANNNSRSIRDYLNDLGLVLQGGDELTGYDNA